MKTMTGCMRVQTIAYRWARVAIVAAVTLCASSGVIRAQGNFAVEFDGMSGNAVADLATGTPAGAMTLEMWFVPGVVAEWKYYLADIRTLGNFPDPHKRLKLYLLGGVIGMTCNQDTAADDPDNQIDDLSGITTTPGLWYHIAVVADGTNLKLYVNGLPALEEEMGVAYGLDGNESLSLASDYWGGGQSNITVDEVRVWSVARSQDSIQANMYRELAPQTEGLLAYYQCNEGEGWTLVDAVSGLHNAIASGGFGWVAGGSPLPITLRSFTAVQSTGGVTLGWSTLSEVNNYGFEIQRSANDTGYQSMQGVFIPGHGTTNEPHSYSVIDSGAGAGPLWYRLKQIDLDGRVHYSDGVRVRILATAPFAEMPVSFVLGQNFPNPWNPVTTIRYGIAKRSFVRLDVYDAVGRHVATLVREEQPAGSHNVAFHGDGLASGEYFYVLCADGTFGVKKSLLIK
jgi:hypothetical protein